ncbi:MAG: hypothetical protein WBA44_02270 [Mesorhizobium sp.]
MKNSKLSFRFKGSRVYVHGTDMFNAINGIMADGNDGYVSDLSFRRPARKNCELHFDKVEMDMCVATGRVRQLSGAEVPFWITEGDSEVQGRVEYDEDLIVTNAAFDDASVRLDQPTRFTLIEEIVALTKALSYRLGPDVDGKWLFGQLKLDAPFPSLYTTREIRRQSFIGNRYSSNEILIDAKPVGQIRFIVGKP